MADKKQLEILKTGVESWNKYRKDNPDLIVDLSKTDLSDFDLSKANLRWTVLLGANLFRASLNEAFLPGADLRKSNLIEVDFRLAKLQMANFIGANLTRCDFSKAKLQGADFRKAKFIDAYLGGAYFFWADLKRADLTRADLYKANLKGAELDLAQLKKVTSLSCVTMPDGTKYGDKWAKKIEESKFPVEYDEKRDTKIME